MSDRYILQRASEFGTADHYSRGCEFEEYFL
jgi:hypothetical protein